MDITRAGGFIWAGGKNGVYRIDQASRKVIGKMKFEKDVTYVKDLLIDHSGNLWVGYDGGLLKYNGKSSQYINTSNGLPDNRVNTLFEDGKGDIWVGTWGGIAVYQENSWHTITQDTGLATNMVNRIMEDSNGGMWFASSLVPNGAISILNQGSWQYITLENGLPNANINAMLEIENGKVLVGTGFYNKGGVCKLLLINGVWTLVNEPIDSWLLGKKVSSIYHDRQNNIWYGTELDGVAVYKDSKRKIFTKEDGISNSEVRVVIEDQNGDYWLGTPSGITFISGKGIKF